MKAKITIPRQKEEDKCKFGYVSCVYIISEEIDRIEEILDNNDIEILSLEEDFISVTNRFCDTLVECHKAQTELKNELKKILK